MTAQLGVPAPNQVNYNHVIQSQGGTMMNEEQLPSRTIPTSRTAELRRLSGAAAAAAAVLTVWLIVRYGAGLHLHAPAFGPTQRLTTVSGGFAVVVAVLAALAGWGVVELLEAKARRPRRAWLVTAPVVLVVSLWAPLSGHGVSSGDRLALICMHLAVGAALTPLYARSLHPNRGSSGSAGLPPRASVPSEGATR
ncbi:MAG: DUF6069 family protein [Acidimicrobiales bacterium]